MMRLSMLLIYDMENSYALEISEIPFEDHEMGMKALLLHATFSQSKKSRKAALDHLIMELKEMHFPTRRHIFTAEFLTWLVFHTMDESVRTRILKILINTPWIKWSANALNKILPHVNGEIRGQLIKIRLKQLKEPLWLHTSGRTYLLSDITGKTPGGTQSVEMVPAYQKYFSGVARPGTNTF